MRAPEAIRITLLTSRAHRLPLPIKTKPASRAPPSRGAAASAPAPFVSPALAEKLDKLGIAREFDLVLHLPLRYEDETRITPLRDYREGIAAQIEMEVDHSEVMYRPRRQLVVKCREIGTRSQELLYLRFLNFYASQVKQLQPGRRLRLFGEVRPGFFGAEMVHPRYHVVEPDTPLPEAMTPIYPTTAGLSQYQLRTLIERALKRAEARGSLNDTLPADMLKTLRLAGFAPSVKTLHNPPPDASLASLSERTHPAWQRLKFDELLAQQLAMRLAHRARRAKIAPRLAPGKMLTQKLIKSLPFKLTKAQHRSFAEISRDLGEPHPMQRLLQGDVGSGKTVVAALAALQAIESGYQVALMAPTEILAEQHFRKIADLLVPLGIITGWLTGSHSAKERKAAKAQIADGSAQLVIGTHALFQEDVAFRKLGLAIIDEQHRFGVGQRLALRLKAKVEPHQLMMSATPIPRTLSMSYFADLDVSVIDELPPGRIPVVTKLVADGRRDEVIERIRAACKEGAQAYWVCPLIEESEKLQLQTAIDTFERLRTTFPDLVVGLVHGRVKAAEKAAVMARFKTGEIQLLVATTVIEVGVDVANASLMVIENAERMGLAQLHQLRGRVGRGAAQSTCILLFQNPLSETARARLKTIYESHDGFEIARRDLQLRGPGEFLGIRQSGVPLLRFADIERDIALLESARTLAEKLIETKSPTVERHLQRWLGDKQHFIKA
jgi:ATP-dependent DNA helicase RecG